MLGLPRLSLSLKIYLFAALVTLGTVTTTGLVMYRLQEREVARILGLLSVNIARTGALFIDGQAHQEIEGNLQAEGAGYKAIRSLLSRIQKENGLEAGAIFTSRRLNATTMEFVVSLERPRVGEYYTPAEEPLTRISALYDTGTAQYTWPYEVKGEKIISAVAPIKDERQQVVGYLQVDVKQSLYLGQMQERLATILMALIIGTVVAGAISVVLASRVTAPVREVQSLVRGVLDGGGDLRRRIPVRSRDVVGDLATAVNDFIALMERLVSRVLQSARAVEAFSKRVLMISESQVHAATEQGAALVETSRTLDELLQSFASTAERSGMVEREARASMGVASSGSSRLAETVNEMERVKATSVETIQEIYALVERSHEIGQVMSLINDVAAKTKLIAFNAAIEASAAGGDTGRRFAVVAQEVRRLAERVVRSTGEIEGIIQDVQGRVQKLILKTEENYRKVERGYQAACDAREAIVEISMSIERASAAAVEISATAHSQRGSGGLVLAALRDIDETTRDFQRAIREMKETADEMDQLVLGMWKQLSRFQVAERATLPGGDEPPPA